MRIASNILCIVTYTTAFRVGYDSIPISKTYGYQNTDDGQGYYYKGDEHGYKPPQAFDVHLPVIQNIEGYDVEPLSYEGKDGVFKNENDGYKTGGGLEYNELHHSTHGEKGNKGYNSKGHHENGLAGHYGKDHKESSFNEDQGDFKSHNDESDIYGKYYQNGGNYEGGDHGHKRFYSKGEEITGYHKLFNKDELIKDHDFYDTAKDSGNSEKHGHQTTNHGSKGNTYDKGGNNNSGYNKHAFNKNDFNSKSYVDEGAIVHSAEEGQEGYYKPEEYFGENGADYYKQKY